VLTSAYPAVWKRFHASNIGFATCTCRMNVTLQTAVLLPIRVKYSANTACDESVAVLR
jgi:hypothetical protein